MALTVLTFSMLNRIRDHLKNDPNPGQCGKAEEAVQLGHDLQGGGEGYSPGLGLPRCHVFKKCKELLRTKDLEILEPKNKP